ncbi:HGGxSTG domain-containing protein [Limnohabitans sp. Rim28]|uniref:HGGxSTG domain-containing protein n=1 Tax=Limnohabitans sp. Rim28 TaxID=1100720 RepID=UPI0003712966|nr:HGGxSTG domain-containing protein [Limnohabitans sp. Rim28]PVE06987.1 hypothetical protein B472_09635 [Limnohabitans sp. Rim28]
MIERVFILKANLLQTAGGRIHCLRCTARSSRTGDQCGRPALKVSKNQKCQYHGGRGSGPKTEKGIARIAAVHTVHGQATKAARAERSLASARLNQLEDAMHVLGMTTAVRSRGRKAQGYVPVKTVADVKRMVIDDFLHRNKGSVEEQEKINRKTHRP